MAWSAWFPAMPQDLSPEPEHPRIFERAPRLRGAVLPAEGPLLPLVLLSHGTGGAAQDLDWLAAALVQAGYLVLGIDHHGNTASEPYRAEGFLCWWERAADLRCLLDHHLTQGALAGRIDPQRIYAAGFSMGGYTVLSAMGAITEVERYRDWARGSRFENGPREFPDLAARLPMLLAESAVFRSAWERQSADFTDPRLQAGLLLAPAPMVRGCREASITAITRPMGLVVGGNDREAPAAACCDWLAARLPAARLHRLEAEAGHYIFMSPCTALGQARAPQLCLDAPGVSRSGAHAVAIAMALERFARPDAASIPP